MAVCSFLRNTGVLKRKVLLMNSYYLLKRGYNITIQLFHLR